MDLESLDDLVSQKEREWKNVTTLQISSLREALSKKEKEFHELSDMFAKLKEDFKYNLKLLQERDKELSRNDEAFSKIKAMESSHLADISDLKIKVEKSRSSLESSKQATNELQRHYRQRLIDQQAEFEAFKSAKDAEVEETLSELNRLKTHHEMQEAKLRAEIEAQKYEMTAEIDKILRGKEREFKEKEDNFSSEALSERLKAKLLSKEIEIMKAAHETQLEALHKVEDANTILKKKLQETEFNLKDMSAMKNARILELEEKNKQLETKQNALCDEFEKRYKELDKDMRIRQANVDACRRNFTEKEKSIELQMREFRMRAETAENETRRTLNEQSELVKNHKKMISRYESELQNIRREHRDEFQKKISEITCKDVQIQNFKKKVELLETEIERLNETVSENRKQIAYSAQKENILLKSKVEMKFDWQKRCEESEAMVESLTKSRDAAYREIQDLQRQQNMPQHVLGGSNYGNIEMGRVKDLEEQNGQLRAIIQQMTADMQQLAGRDDQSTQQSDGDESPARKLLEHKGTQTVEPQESVQRTTPPSPTPVVSASFSHPDVKSHIASLNGTIGNLRAEKLDIGTQLQRVQVRLRHQESLLNTRENDVKKQVAHTREVEYRLSAAARRAEQEAESLKRQISDLELQLAEARTEADEYYRRGIQNNLLATELGSELSKIKVEKAAKTPWMSGVTQANVVQELQSEITKLRKQLVEAKQALILGKADEKPSKATALNKHLHDKLRLAASQIANLLSEKSKLLESGNSLRAELERYKKSHPENVAVTPEKETDSEKIPNKLDEMEDLQYQLTKQELQYAQKVSPRKPLPQLVEKLTPPTTSTPEPTNQVERPTRQPTQYSLSSVGDGSMKNIWNLLDQEPSSPSLPGSTAGSIVAPEPPSNDPRVGLNRGTKLTRPATKSQQRVKSKGKPLKIRNYNVRDDKEARKLFKK